MIARLCCWLARIRARLSVFARDPFADVTCGRCGRVLFPAQEYVAGEGWRPRR